MKENGGSYLNNNPDSLSYKSKRKSQGMNSQRHMNNDIDLSELNILMNGTNNSILESADKAEKLIDILPQKQEL